jgi:AcrR family transcriptional regulator
MSRKDDRMARAGLNRDRVLAAAMELADERGIGALTMRGLASSLGVEAMSLYNHVSDKQDVLAGMSGGVWGEVDLAVGEPDWRLAIHRIAGSAHRSMVAHPWFLSLPVMYGGLPRTRVIDAILGHLRNEGIGADVTFHALHVLDGHVFGFSWQAVGYLDMDGVVKAGEAVLDALAPGELPHLLEHAGQHFDDRPEGDGFIFGLDLLLDGFERLKLP